MSQLDLVPPIKYIPQPLRKLMRTTALVLTVGTGVVFLVDNIKNDNYFEETPFLKQAREDIPPAIKFIFEGRENFRVSQSGFIPNYYLIQGPGNTLFHLRKVSDKRYGKYWVLESDSKTISGDPLIVYNITQKTFDEFISPKINNPSK